MLLIFLLFSPAKPSDMNDPIRSDSIRYAPRERARLLCGVCEQRGLQRQHPAEHDRDEERRCEDSKGAAPRRAFIYATGIRVGLRVLGVGGWGLGLGA